MNKFDPKITKEIQAWLDTPAESRDIVAGANLMLSLNRNRALHNAAIARPARYAAKVEYELKKLLKIRLANMTMQEVAELDKTVMPKAEEIISEPPTVEDEPSVISTDDEQPQPKVAKGKRADHDTLPEEIQKLWEDNFELYKVIKQLFEELKSMSHLQPCDRFDKLKLLEAADSKYRGNLAKYDIYVPHEEPAPEKTEPSAADIAKAISAARKTMSKAKESYFKATTDADRDTVKAKIQDCVNKLISYGSSFSKSTIDELTPIGIVFE